MRERSFDRVRESVYEREIERERESAPRARSGGRYVTSTFKSSDVFGGLFDRSHTVFWRGGGGSRVPASRGGQTRGHGASSARYLPQA